MSFESTQTLYQTFVNAFSYTLAITTVNKLVETGGHDLLVLAGAVGLTIVLLSRILAELKKARQVLEENNGHLKIVLKGPLEMTLFLITTAISVLVQFLSSALGQWSITLAGSEVDTIVPTVIIGTSLIWLLGASSNLIQS